MPVLKPISGHSRSVKAAIDYLTRKQRALAADFVNCEETDRFGRPTWRQMDEARHALGCDVAVGPHKRVRTYEHFVLSPDPKDRVTLETLRRLVVAWAEEYFGDYQVAIYYHDDNNLCIPHTHLIVNNANLCKPGHVSTILTPKFEAEMFERLQRMAAEMGLHAFTERPTSVNEAERARADRQRVANERPKGTVQRTYRTKQDTEIEAKGISWKADIRDRIACALAVSRTEEEFLESCRALGLGVRESRGKKAGRDYVYTHPARETWQVSGARLGRNWSRWGVQRKLASDRRRKVPKPRQASRKRLLSAIASLGHKGISMQVIGTTSGIAVTARDVTGMLATLAELQA